MASTLINDRRKTWYNFYIILSIDKLKTIVMKKTLLLAGIGAFAYYMYKKMSPEEKQKITDSIRQTGKKFTDKLPGEWKDALSGKPQEA